MPLAAQDSKFESQLRSGEFSLALAATAAETDPQLRDQMYQRIAQAQRAGDTGLNAFHTLTRVQDDASRFSSFDELTRYDGDSGAEGEGDLPGSAGGITIADFGPLMNLIQETIDPDSWEQNGGVGRMLPFPAGVWVDPAGTMKRIQPDASERLNRLGRGSFRSVEDSTLWQATELRKVSLRDLERQLQFRQAAGLAISPELEHLAGIYRLQYVMLYPETQDVVIAGPAGPWHYDRDGRAINTETGFAVLNLDDLVVCLRNARRNQGQFGCSIDPRPANLAAARQLIDTSTLKGQALREQLQQTLGQMDVTIQGIDPTSHAASVIVEADYRMKLIGLGVEPSVSGLKNYFERIRLEDDGNLPEVDQLVRWWFTMDYESITTNDDRTIFEISGKGVKLLSESEFWNQQGERVHTGQSSPPASGFARDFSTRFAEIAYQDAVFGELKNLFDCALAASVIHSEGMHRQVQWDLRFLDGTVRPGLLSYQPAINGIPLQVDSILGQRVLTHHDGRRSVRHTISGFGGGVEFDASRYAQKSKIRQSAAVPLQSAYQTSAPLRSQPGEGRWAWD